MLFRHRLVDTATCPHLSRDLIAALGEYLERRQKEQRQHCPVEQAADDRSRHRVVLRIGKCRVPHRERQKPR